MPESWSVGRGPVVVRPGLTTGRVLKYPKRIVRRSTTGQVIRLANGVGPDVENLRIRPVAVSGRPARQPKAGAVELVDAKAATAHAPTRWPTVLYTPPRVEPTLEPCK